MKPFIILVLFSLPTLTFAQAYNNPWPQYEQQQQLQNLQQSQYQQQQQMLLNQQQDLMRQNLQMQQGSGSPCIVLPNGVMECR